MKHLYILLLLVVSSMVCAQSSQTTTQQPTIPATGKQYVIVNAKDHLFCCPVLTPRFTKRMQRKYAAHDFVIGKDNNTLSFVVENIQITSDSLRADAQKCNIPPEFVLKIDMSSVPFTDTKPNDAK